MPDPNVYPLAPQTLLNNLVELLRHQNERDIVKLLTNASCRIEVTGADEFADGYFYYTVFLEVPIPQYAHAEKQVEELETKLHKKVKSLVIEPNHGAITQVKIKPQLTVAGQPKKEIAPSESAHIWEDGGLKIFLSHVSKHKKKVVELKDYLKEYQVSAFVAHEDIEPSRKWQKEIELALQTMDVFVPLLTEDFHESNWTDQEVGIAVGLGVLIIPVRLGHDPYGFMGENQGLSGDLKNPRELAIGIVDVLMKNVRFAPLMRELMVTALENAENFIDSRLVAERLTKVNDFTDEQVKRLEKALKDNDQVYKAFKVPEWIGEVVKKHKKASKRK